MAHVRGDYYSLYFWLKGEWLNETLSAAPTPLTPILLDTIRSLPHPEVANNRDIEIVCTKLQFELDRILEEEEIPGDIPRQEFEKYRRLADELAKRTREVAEEPSDQKFHQIENLLEELLETTSSTNRRVESVTSRL